jgi:hypothetical protein
MKIEVSQNPPGTSNGTKLSIDSSFTSPATGVAFLEVLKVSGTPESLILGFVKGSKISPIRIRTARGQSK